jgi:dihydroorotase
MHRFDLVLRGCEAVLPSGTSVMDIAVSGGRIVAFFAPGTAPGGSSEIDCAGLTALPGLIDTHGHHREPGYTHKEDIVTAGMQYAAGGVTVSLAMPNVNPVPATPETLDEMLDLYRRRSLIDYNVNASAAEVDQIPSLAERGILAFKVFMVADTKRTYPHIPGTGVHDHGELFRIFRAVAATGLPLMVHPHDQALMRVIEQDSWDRDERDFRAYARSFAAHDGLIWDVAIGILLRLQQAADVHLHLMHMQTRRGVEQLRAAKAAGCRVSAEINPWCLWLGNDWQNVERLGPYALSFYVPPDGAEATGEAFRSGIIDVLGSDHTPHTREEKEPGWTDGWKAQGGTPSAQFYLSLLLTDVAAGRISLARAVEATALAPARLFGLYPRKGVLAIGADADIALVDRAAQFVVRESDVLSRCGWTPYEGRTLTGKVIHTILRGQTIFSSGAVVAAPGTGRQALRASSSAN